MGKRKARKNRMDKKLWFNSHFNLCIFPKHKVKEDIKKDLLKERQEISKILTSRKHLNELERLKQREDEIFNKLLDDIAISPTSVKNVVGLLLLLLEGFIIFTQGILFKMEL